MPVTLQQVVEHVVAIEELEQPGTTDPGKVRGIVREVIAALGLLVNARNDEVYNPAPKSSIPEDNYRKSVRYPKSRYR